MKSASHMLDTIQRTHTGGAGLTLHVSHPAYTNDAGRIALRDDERGQDEADSDGHAGCMTPLFVGCAVLVILGLWLNR